MTSEASAFQSYRRVRNKPCNMTKEETIIGAPLYQFATDALKMSQTRWQTTEINFLLTLDVRHSRSKCQHVLLLRPLSLACKWSPSCCCFTWSSLCACMFLVSLPTGHVCSWCLFMLCMHVPSVSSRFMHACSWWLFTRPNFLFL